MSLFNETVAKVHKLETELAAAHERIRNLEIALNAARRDRLKAMEGRYGGSPTAVRYSKPVFTGKPDHDLNSLTEEDVKELFRQHEDAKIDDQVEEWSKPPSTNGKEATARRGFLAPALRMCALLLQR